MDNTQTENETDGGLSDLTTVLGRWMVTKDTPTRMGNSVFTLPAGVEVSVQQIDLEYGKVLVDAAGSIDWMHWSWLRNCERPNAKVSGASDD